MQEREEVPAVRTPLEALLARSDEAGLDYVSTCLLAGEPIEPSRAPAAAARNRRAGDGR